jgi:hypothetical protein
MDEKRGLHNPIPDDVPPSYSKPETSQNGLTPTLSPFRTRFACISLHMTDRIRLLRFPSTDIPPIRTIIAQSWPRGIQDLRNYDQSSEMKLHGNPWSTSAREQKTEARGLVMGLLAGLFEMGWVLKASVDVSKKEYDKGTCDCLNGCACEFCFA